MFSQIMFFKTVFSGCLITAQVGLGRAWQFYKPGEVICVNEMYFNAVKVIYVVRGCIVYSLTNKLNNGDCTM